MMNSVRLFLKNFIKYFFYIAVFAQIVSGTVYLVCNFTEYIVYPETEEMIHIARGLVFDEYTGILYPLFIRLCLGIQESFGIGYYLVAHLVQLILFIVAAFYLAGSVFRKKSVWLLVCYLISFPMCIQTILMVSPMAFKAIFAFFLVGALVRITRGYGKPGTWIGMFLAYMMASLNVPDDLYIWLVPLALWGCVYFFKNRKKCALWKRVCLIFTIVMVFFATFFVLDSVIDAGNRGRMQRTVSSVLFQRSIWPNLVQKHGFMPLEIKEIVDMDMLLSGEFSSESISCVIGPAIERTVGLERANELYMETFKGQLSYNKRALFRAVADDFMGYLFVPYSTVFHMMGQEGSAYSTLYGLISAKNPVGVYGYFCVSFVSIFLLSFRKLLMMIRKRSWIQSSLKKKAAFFILILIYQALWYAIANVQGVDYRYGLLNVAILVCFVIDDEWLRERKTKRTLKFTKKSAAITGGCILISGIALIGSLVLKNDYKESDLLSGKTIVCFGDSIWGAVRDETGIASKVEKMTGATVVNYAIPGSTASKTKGTIKEDASSDYSLMEIIEGLENEAFENDLLETIRPDVLENADYLILAYGLNDYFQGVPAEVEDDSYESYLRFAVSYFKEHYPNLQIVLIGQTYSQVYSYGIVQEDSNTKNFGGGVGTDYVKAAEKIAKEQEVLFINQYDSLPINEWNGKIYLEDAVHLNEKGRREYAKVVAECILEDYKERNAK